MTKATNELKNIDDIEGKKLVLRRRETTQRDPETDEPYTAIEIVFSLYGEPVDADGNEIMRYDFKPSVKKTTGMMLKNDYPDIWNALSVVWTYMLNELRTREGI